jgi:hypothetical protein
MRYSISEKKIGSLYKQFVTLHDESEAYNFYVIIFQ